MERFNNNRIVNMKDLRKSGLYSDELLDSLMAGNFEKLGELPIETRAEIDYMEPLLYAVKNELDTYQVYKYYTESLQDNYELASEIIMTEPNLIENTPVSRNKEFIIENAKTTPEIIQYMSPELKKDDEFIQELNEIKIPEIREEIAKNCEVSVLILNNPELNSDKDFMSNAIEQNAEYLDLASDELKNDYEFIKQACDNNKEAIDYISEHTENFGNEAITAAKEVLVEETTTKSIDDFETELEEVNKQLEDNKELNENERKQLEIRKRQLNNSIKFINKIKEGKVNPERAIRLINSLCENLGEEYRQELMKYIKMDDAIVERKKETEDKEISGVGIEEVEEKTSEATTSGISEETNVIKDEVTKDREEGEKENDDTHDTRA